MSYSTSDSSTLAEAITRAASTQTYYTIRLLADRPLAAQAYRAYAYFRWVDDVIDEQLTQKAERLAFVRRQQGIMARCYAGDPAGDLAPQERLVADLIGGDGDPSSGLGTYLSQMMAVMAFDAGRQGRLISQLELDMYTLRLAVAVTEALHAFIGRNSAAPQGAARYQAVSAAHITHMLRDAMEDVDNGYINIPREVLEARNIAPWDFHHPAYVAWVAERAALARRLFANGRRNLALVESRRCRLAGEAYIGRFEVVLEAIAADGYRLRAAYPERKSRRAALRIGLGALRGLLARPAETVIPAPVEAPLAGGMA